MKYITILDIPYNTRSHDALLNYIERYNVKVIFWDRFSAYSNNQKGGERKMEPILKKSKKGSLNLIIPAILALVLAASILTFGLIISEKLRDTATAGSEAFKAANKTVVGLGTFADFWSIIVLAVVIAVVVGLLLMVLSAPKPK